MIISTGQTAKTYTVHNTRIDPTSGGVLAQWEDQSIVDMGTELAAAISGATVTRRTPESVEVVSHICQYSGAVTYTLYQLVSESEIVVITAVPQKDIEVYQIKGRTRFFESESAAMSANWEELPLIKRKSAKRLYKALRNHIALMYRFAQRKAKDTDTKAQKKERDFLRSLTELPHDESVNLSMLSMWYSNWESAKQSYRILVPRDNVRYEYKTALAGKGTAVHIVQFRIDGERVYSPSSLCGVTSANNRQFKSKSGVHSINRYKEVTCKNCKAKANEKNITLSN